MIIKSNLINGVFLAAAVLFISNYSFAQESTMEKLNNIKEDVDKITIKAGDEEIIFEDKEAMKLFKKMKASSHSVNSYVIKEDGDSSGTKKIIIKTDGDETIYEFNEEQGGEMVWFTDEGEMNNMDKRIEVQIENGQKKVTVTTKENGEEKTTVYEGAEADEYLEKMKSEHGNEMLMEIDEDGSKKKIKKIIIEKEKKE